MKSKPYDIKSNPALAFINTGTQEPTEAPKKAEPIPAIPSTPSQEAEAPQGYKLAEIKDKRVQLVLNSSTVANLKALAKEQGLSMNEAANRAVKEYLEKYGK